ncbi:MAG: cupin domain-containing protein [Lentisphaeraceae bacterium]|nr:cupin domain-containing protein [Lentisphaeraceae bacterium]
MKDIRAEDVIAKLKLLQHPEGGWYSETYRSGDDTVTSRGVRQLATVIYFMLKGDEKSAFHRLKSDEFWYFHQGANLDVHVIYEDGTYTKFDLGTIGEKGSLPQLFLPAGTWFAAECQDKEAYSLVSCSVHPGFDFADFELASQANLLGLYPQYSELISQFCII